VQEDAGPVDDPRGQVARLCALERTTPSAVAELPLVRSERGRRPLDARRVLVVSEVCAVRAAPLAELGGGLREHALAPPSEDAGPRAEQEGDVEDPRPVLVGVLEAHPLVQAVGVLVLASRPRHQGHGSRDVRPSAGYAPISPPRRRARHFRPNVEQDNDTSAPRSTRKPLRSVSRASGPAVRTARPTTLLSTTRLRRGEAALLRPARQRAPGRHL